MTFTLGICAGEASGDRLGAGLMQALKSHPELRDNIAFIGVGGPLMVAQGLEPLADYDLLSVHGFKEPLLRLPALLRLYRNLAETFSARQVDVFVGVDFNVFNFLLEAALRRRGMTTIHYVSPSVYAWRRGRTRKVARCADELLCLFPFEPAFYANLPLKTTFVGHPMASEINASEQAKAPARESLLIESKATVMAILPGSRRSEVDLLLETGLLTAASVFQQLADDEQCFQVSIPCVTEAIRDQVAQRLATLPNLGFPVMLHLGDARQVLTACDLALVKSGTSTLEAMLLRRPMVVFYRLGFWTYRLVRALLKTPYVAVPNILAGRPLIPEFIQDAAQPERMAAALLDQWRRAKQEADFYREHESLHTQLRSGDLGGGADWGAAQRVMYWLTR